MNKLLLIGLFAYTLIGCQKAKDVLPDYPDWYAVKSPEPADIQAAYGNIDNTLIVITRVNIYITNDRGKSWIMPKRDDASHGLFGFSVANDTLVLLDGGSTITNDPVYYATGPYQYSIDGGLSWKSYRTARRFRTPLNQLKTSSGTVYTIDELLTPRAPGSSYIETVGISVSDGRKLILPNRQQIRSIYFDSRNRLYATGSAAICGGLKDFRFCGDKNGILYVSKQPQP